MLSFSEKLRLSQSQKNSLLCLGLDPHISQFPASLQAVPPRQAILEFCRNIVHATLPYLCAIKPQIAYFAAQGAEAELETLIDEIQQKTPELPVILDAKRGDIGETSQQYAREAFERYRADAVTVHPYMGEDSWRPYLAYPGKTVFILCRTSNPSSAAIQLLTAQGQPLYQHVAQLAQSSMPASQLGLVMGATAPTDIATIRQQVGPDLPFLVPGIGAQQGDLNAVLQAGLNAQGTGLIIACSRSILYASHDENYAEAAAASALTLMHSINQHRQHLTRR